MRARRQKRLRDRAHRLATPTRYASSLKSNCSKPSTNGRAEVIRSCARLRRAAATSFMALVICRADLKVFTFRLSSRNEAIFKFRDQSGDPRDKSIRHFFAVVDVRKNFLIFGFDVGEQTGFEFPARGSRGYRREYPRTPAKIDDDLLRHVERRVLALLEQLDHALSAREFLLRRFVQLGRELRERREFVVLRQVQAERPGDLPHRLDLRAARRRATPRGRRSRPAGRRNRTSCSRDKFVRR